MLYSIADFLVEYTPRYERLLMRSRKYLADNQGDTADFSLAVSEAEIDEHLKKYEATRDLAEYVLMGAKFYKEILGRDAFFLHSSAVAVDGFGYAFTGPCGAGKSTHSALWREYFGTKAIAVNDDKPVVRLAGDDVFVSGTPFSGKNDINTNISVPLKGICVMNQAPENSIEKLTAREALSVIMEQTLRPEEPDKIFALLDALDKTLSKVPVYKLNCTKSFEAVKLCYNTLSK